MQKFYILLSLLLLTFSVAAAEPSSKPTWDIIEFKPSDWVNGKRTLSIGDHSVDVEFNHFKFETLTTASVVLDKEYPSFDYVAMFDELAANNPANRELAATLTFMPKGGFSITKIEFVGHARAASRSLLSLFVSTTGTYYEEGGRNPKDDFIASTHKMLTFEPSYDTPEGVCNLDVAEISPDDLEIQRDAKYIRVYWSAAKVAKIQLTRGGGSTDLFGFRIYTDIIPTGIGEDVADAYTMTQSGSTLEFSELSNVEIYSLSGKLVDSVKGSSDFSVENLAKGAYIVRAISLESNTPLVKKILR